MRRLVPLLCLLLVCGCVDRLAQRQAFLNGLVGHSEKDLVEAMGVPNRTYETGGVKFLAYEDSRVALLPSPYGPGPWWRYGGYGGGLPPQVITRTCETTFAVADGVVKSYALHGNACG